MTKLVKLPPKRHVENEMTQAWTIVDETGHQVAICDTQAVADALLLGMQLQQGVTIVVLGDYAEDLEVECNAKVHQAYQIDNLPGDHEPDAVDYVANCGTVERAMVSSLISRSHITNDTLRALDVDINGDESQYHPSRRITKQGVTLIRVELPPKAYEGLQRLQQETGGTSLEETFAKALEQYGVVEEDGVFRTKESED